MKYRIEAWQRLAGDFKYDKLEGNCKVIALSDLQQHIDLMLQGKLKGRTIVKIV